MGTIKAPQPPRGPKPCTSCDCMIFVSRAPANYPGQAAGSCAGCGGSTSVFSANPVRYWDGSIYLAEVDIATPYGGFLDWQRRYNLIPGSTSDDLDGDNGMNWFMPALPYMFINGGVTEAAVVFDPNNPFWFAKPSSSWNPMHGASDVSLTGGGGGSDYAFTRNSAAGMEVTTFLSTGKFKNHTDAAGIQTTATYNGSGVLTLLSRTLNDGTSNVVEQLTFDVTSGRIDSVTYTRNVGGAGAVNIRKVLYTYYDGTTAFGSAGDLESVTQQEPSGMTWVSIAQSYYRYYKGGLSGGIAHGLLLHLGPEAVRRATQDNVNVFTVGNSTLKDYADHEFVYDANRRVEYETAAVCVSCPGGGTTEDHFTFTDRGGSPSAAPNVWHRKTEQQLPNGAVITVYSDHIGMPLFEVYDDNGSQWCKAWQYDSDYNILFVAESSAIDNSKWDEAYDDLVDWANSTAVFSGTGLIRKSEYGASTTGDNTTGWTVTGYLERESVQEGTGGTAITLREYLYYQRDNGSGNLTYLPHTVTVYRDDAGLDDVSTTFGYTFQSGSNFVATRTTTPPDTSGQNGKSPSNTVETFDVYGNLTQRVRASGVSGVEVTDKFEYDRSLRTMTRSILNYKSSPSGPGESVTTDYTYDVLGRLTQTLGPAHSVDISGSATSVRTATWHAYVKHAKPTLGSPWPLDEHRSLSGYRTGSGPYTYTSLGPVSLTRTDKSGRSIDQITVEFTSTSGSSVPISDSTSLPQSDWCAWTHSDYNDQGRLTATRVYHNIPSSGTGSSPTNYGETSFGYDDLERVVMRKAPGGTITRTVWAAPQRVLSVWVGTNDTGATPTDPDGTGSPNNMKVVTTNEYDGGSDGGDGNLTEVTQHVDGTTTRVTTFAYDFRNRRTSTAGELNNDATFTYDNLDRVTQVERYDGTPTLIGQSTTAYDNLGRVYEQRTYSVTSGSAGNYLTASTWHDDLGRAYRTVAAGGHKTFTHTTFNGAGWVTGVYRGVGTSTSLSSNVIATQTLNTYDDAGNLISTASYDRLNDESDATTGALTTSNARVSYVAIYPDAIGRNQATVNYGALSSFTRSSTIPTRDNARLITSTLYGPDGRPQTVTDPMGINTVTSYDHAGRRTILEEAVGTSDQRETDWTYTLDNLVATQVALNDDTGNQTTTYTYGSTLTDSDVARNDLLVRVAYPDSTGSSDTVYTTYNRQGQKKTVTDPRGVVHTYVYDDLGRLSMDQVTTCPGGVNDDVLCIETTYDARGRLEHVTSYDSDDNSGTVVNDVQMEYNGFNQLTKEYQSHSGLVNTSTTPKVQYGYEPGNVSATQTNNIRPTTLTYPNGRVITYQYGTSNGLNDYLNRANEIYDTTNTQSLATYDYLGSGLAVRVNYPEPSVRLDLWGGTTGTFSGLDVFNRVTDQKWRKYGGTTTILDQYTYTYDRNSNRLTRGNGTHAPFDEAYTYDNLNRLTRMERGGGSLNFTEDWNLDATGNWLGYETTDGTNTTLTQGRTANEANEITDITSTPTWADPTYDAAGNMTRFPMPGGPASNFVADYDAWNRLVSIGDGIGMVLGIGVDGLGRTQVLQEYISHVASTLHHWYVSAASQRLERRIGSSTSSSEQCAFGLLFVDNVIQRIANSSAYITADAVFTVTSTVDAGGVVGDRFSYDSYGQGSTFTNLWVLQSVLSTGFGLNGRPLSGIPALYDFRARIAYSTVGRYVQRDPKGYIDGASLYLLNRSSTPNFVDPTGTGPCEHAPYPNPNPRSTNPSLHQDCSAWAVCYVHNLPASKMNIGCAATAWDKAIKCCKETSNRTLCEGEARKALASCNNLPNPTISRWDCLFECWEKRVPEACGDLCKGCDWMMDRVSDCSTVCDQLGTGCIADACNHACLFGLLVGVVGPCFACGACQGRVLGDCAIFCGLQF